MKICNCHIDLDKKLCFIPTEWRKPIVDAICLVLHSDKDECLTVKNCETRTELQPFTLNGTLLSIKYKDERGVIKTSTIDLSIPMNNVLDDIDPLCLMDVEDWQALTHKEKIQALIDAKCECCDCVTYNVTNTTGDIKQIQYTDCADEVQTVNLNPFEQMEICFILGTLVLAAGVTAYLLNKDCSTTTSTSTTTTTTADPCVGCPTTEFDIHNLAGDVITDIQVNGLTITLNGGEVFPITTTNVFADVPSGTVDIEVTVQAGGLPTVLTLVDNTEGCGFVYCEPVLAGTNTYTFTDVPIKCNLLIRTAVGNCTTTTTTSTTTTTTEAPEYDYYLANKRQCYDCDTILEQVVVYFFAGTGVILGSHYTPTPSDGFAYELLTPVGPAAGVDLTASEFHANCLQLCSDTNPTTTTTTTTTSSTTTTSTSTTTTTTSAPVSEVTVFGEDFGGGNIVFTAIVTGAATLDDLTFEGEVQRYSDGDCSAIIGSSCSFSGVTLTTGSGSTSSGVICSGGGTQTLKVTVLSVNGTPVTSSPQNVVVGGNTYTIVGWNVCGGL